MSKIKVAIVGIGNCASSLIQGIHYYRNKTLDDAIGLMHWEQTYNRIRPHQALGYLTPLAFIEQCQQKSGKEVTCH